MTYNVTATRWKQYWELDIEGVGVTQSRTLGTAEYMVRDYLALDDAPDAATAEIIIHPKIDGLENLADSARRELATARAAQDSAAKASRRVVKELRDAGLSVADTAVIMGVTKGRISQLTS